MPNSYYLYRKYEKIHGNFEPINPPIYSIDGEGTMPKVVHINNDPLCTPYKIVYGGGNIYIQYNLRRFYPYATGSTFSGGTGLIGFSEPLVIIGDRPFFDLGRQTEIIIPDSVISIGSSALSYSTLTSITLGNSVTSIGTSCFARSSIKNFNMPNSVISVGGLAFSGCTSLTSVSISNNLKIIPYRCFVGCNSLTDVYIPDSVTIIGGDAFWDCSGLTSIDIPNSVISIGMGAFDDCESLTSVTINATTPPTLGQFAFDDTNNCPIYVPSGSVNAYKTATNWSNYASRIRAIT